MTKGNKSNLERETLRIFWQVVWQNKGLFLRSLVYLGGIVGIYVLVPLFVSMTLADLATRSGNVAGHLIPLAIAAAFGVVCNYFGFTDVLRLQAKCQYDLFEMALTALLRRSVGFHANNIGGKLVSNALDFPGGFGRLLDAVFVNITPFLLSMAVGIVIILVRAPIMGLALVGVVGVTVALIFIDSRRRSRLRVTRKQAQNAMIAHISDTIVNAVAVKTFAREDAELHQHSQLSHKLLSLRLRDWSMTVRAGTLRMGVLLALQIAFIALVAYLLQRDPSVLGIGIFAFSYTITLTNRLFDVGAMLLNIDEAFLMAASMTEILQDEIEVVDTPGARKLRIAKGTISLEDVTFAYHDSSNDETVFRDLTVTIPAGQKIGLVGPSGGGKSTLTRLLLRFDDVTRGRIAIDDQDVRQVTQQSLREAISYVPQEPLLFHRSIFDNIAYGKANASIKDVRRAAEQAYASDFIDKLPGGYDTIVGERGVKLSGGQRQRIAIARAILKDAPILVLDEATSALDSESEMYIQKALERLMKGRTTLVIAHRLSTIQKMDRIIVLDEGQIVEDGTHKVLLKANNLYAKLWSHQTGGFIEE